jgi:hypothetical protein
MYWPILKGYYCFIIFLNTGKKQAILVLSFFNIIITFFVFFFILEFWNFLKFWKILKLARIFKCESILGNMRFTLKHAKRVFICFITVTHSSNQWNLITMKNNKDDYGQLLWIYCIYNVLNYDGLWLLLLLLSFFVQISLLFTA